MIENVNILQWVSARKTHWSYVFLALTHRNVLLCFLKWIQPPPHLLWLASLFPHPTHWPCFSSRPRQGCCSSSKTCKSSTLGSNIATRAPSSNRCCAMEILGDSLQERNMVIIRNWYSGLILGLRLANERQRCFVTTSLIGWAQTYNQPV